MVEEIEGLDNQVQLPTLADLEEFQYAQVHLCLTASVQRVSSKTERARRQWKSSTAVCIETCQCVDRPAAADCQNWSGFNVAEYLGNHTRRLLRFILVPERQIERSTENEPMLLIIG